MPRKKDAHKKSGSSWFSRFFGGRPSPSPNSPKINLASPSTERSSSSLVSSTIGGSSASSTLRPDPSPAYQSKPSTKTYPKSSLQVSPRASPQDSSRASVLYESSDAPAISASPSAPSPATKPLVMSGIKHMLQLSEKALSLCPIPGLNLIASSLLKFLEMYDVCKHSENWQWAGANIPCRAQMRIPRISAGWNRLSDP